ncbi:hypothetical protein NDU88_006031 [Pleurodeles waltl]|uniref:Uncharacterized protein n=1 Tax=Pleurodeles waltl TaxID=8319 RepID=A0AAV7WF18_PLEWA|nr:hypothetical protein NDU88_006031 [Pleurodeles waltl]
METWRLTNEETVGSLEQASQHYYAGNGASVHRRVALWKAHKATIKGVLIAGKVGDHRKQHKRLTKLEDEQLTLEKVYVASHSGDSQVIVEELAL